MQKNVSLIVVNDAVPITRDIVEDIADTLAVDTVGFFAHSSFDASILETPRINSAVLCDPVALPRIAIQLNTIQNSISNFDSVSVDSDARFLILKAGLAYAEDAETDEVMSNGSSPPRIPNFLTPRTPADRTTSVVIHDVGHADLLDDPWANLGNRILPWMRGVSVPIRPFLQWKYDGDRRVSLTRKEYRCRVARAASDHILGDDSSAQNFILDSPSVES